MGGLTEARKVANWCETHYIRIVPHNPLGPVSAAACLHLDVATDNFAVQEGGLVGRTVMEDLFPVQVPYESGHLLVSDRPGLGGGIRRGRDRKIPVPVGARPPAETGRRFVHELVGIPGGARRSVAGYRTRRGREHDSASEMNSQKKGYAELA